MKKTAIALLVGSSVMLSGCSTPELRGAISESQVKVEPPPATPYRGESAIGSSEEKDISLSIEEVDDSTFVLTDVAVGDAMPEVYIKGVTLTDFAVPEALRLIANKVGMSSSVRGAPIPGASPTISINNLSGRLEDVLEEFANSVGGWIVYRKGILRLDYEKQFIVQLPPVVGDDTISGITNTISSLGATSLSLDKVGRTVSFRSNRQAHDQISAYLKWNRENRPLIVYETQVFQVTLNDQSQFGIKWDDLAKSAGGALKLGATASTGAAAASPSFSMVYQGSAFSVNSLVSFLSSQGTVSTLAQPRIAMLSGASGLIKQGQVTNYVSEIGSNQNGTTTSTTAKTSTVQTGLDMYINGEFHDKTVFSRINLVLAELLRFNEFTVPGAAGTTASKLSLPQTANREIKTEVRSRPGDTILLGGISAMRSVMDVSGLPGVDKPISVATDSNKTGERTELVIVLRPKVVKFKVTQIEKSLIAKKSSSYVPDVLLKDDGIALSSVPVAKNPKDQKSDAAPVAMKVLDQVYKKDSDVQSLSKVKMEAQSPVVKKPIEKEKFFKKKLKNSESTKGEADK